MSSLSAAIEALAPVAEIRRSVLLYGLVNATHILGIALLVGSIVGVDLRLAGLWRGETWREAMAALLPVARAGFALAALTGLLLFAVRASKYVETPAFLIKMAIIAAALVNIALFHAILARGGEGRTAMMRASGAVSLVCWIAAVFAGRWIAFQ